MATDQTRTVLVAPWFTINPYLRELGRALEDHGWTAKPGGRRLRTLLKQTVVTRPAALHLHWTEAYLSRGGSLVCALRGACLVTVVAALRLARIRTVWTVHNLVGHDTRHPALERALQRALGRVVATIVVHAEGAVGLVAAQVGCPRDRIRVIPMGSYVDAQPPRERSVARKELGLREEDRVVVALGLMRRYKRLDLLIEAMQELDDPHVRVLIAGPCRDDVLASELVRLADGDDRISVRPGHLSDEEFTTMLSAGDVFVLASAETHLQSSSILAAAAAGVPVVAHDKILKRHDFPADGSVGYSTETAAAIRTAVRRAMDVLSPPVSELAAWAASATWDRTAESTAALYLGGKQ